MLQVLPQVLVIKFLLIFHIIRSADALFAINNHLTGDDRLRLRELFFSGIKSNNLQAIYYSALNLKDVTDEDEKSKVCSRLISLHNESKFEVCKLSVATTELKIIIFHYRVTRNISTTSVCIVCLVVLIKSQK